MFGIPNEACGDLFDDENENLFHCIKNEMVAAIRTMERLCSQEVIAIYMLVQVRLISFVAYSFIAHPH